MLQILKVLQMPRNPWAQDRKTKFVEDNRERHKKKKNGNGKRKRIRRGNRLVIYV